MKRLLFAGLASLVLACSSSETKCKELSNELERTRIEMENARPEYCPTTAMIGMYGGSYQCKGNKEKFDKLQAAYEELRNMHYEECDQVPVNTN